MDEQPWSKSGQLADPVTRCRLLAQGTPVRVVLVSSLGHLGGKLDRADLLSQRTSVAGSQVGSICTALMEAFLSDRVQADSHTG